MASKTPYSKPLQHIKMMMILLTIEADKNYAELPVVNFED
jgi:hypothetical protein